MKTKIIDGKDLSAAELAETGRLLYLTDPEIYPTAFASAENMGKVFPFLAAKETGMFSPRNVLVARCDGEIAGALVGCNANEWKKGDLAEAFSKADLPLPRSAEDAEENYFAYEATHEKGDYLLCLVTSPSHRGKGIATSLLARYLKGKNEVSRECLADNPAAIKLYEKAGFETVSRYEGYSSPGTPLVPVVRMVWKKPLVTVL